MTKQRIDVYMKQNAAPRLTAKQSRRLGKKVRIKWKRARG